MTNAVDWPEAVWQEINDAVLAEVSKVRTAQKVFPTSVLDGDPTEVANDVIEFPEVPRRAGGPRRYLSIREGQTKPFVEIYLEFPLTTAQVTREAQLKTCKTLARMAAKAVGLAEDVVLFQGSDGKLPADVIADPALAGKGLLGESQRGDADDDNPYRVSRPIPVIPPEGRRKGVTWGEATFSAVTDGIALLAAKAQAPKFALFLPVRAYADTFVPPGDQSLITTAERIKPLVEGGFMEVVTLPETKGLLVALAGDPTSLHVGREATTEFVRKEGAQYFFRVVERIQFVARDARAFVLLDFQPPQDAEGTESS